MSGESAVTTIDDLDAMLSKLDGDEVVKFFAGMTEKERKPFAERAMLWYEIGLANIETSLFWGNVLAFSDDLPKRTREQITLLKKVESGEIKISSKVKSRESTGVSRLALTACAGLSELRKLPFPDAKPAFEIMRDRKPKWLDRWLDFACGLTPYESWELAREFEREGICQAEHGEGYWLAMALTLGQKPADELVAVLNSDAELIDTMVWQMLGSDAAIRALSDPTGINAQVNDRRRVTLDTDWRNWSLRVENSRRASYIWRTVLADCAQKNQSYQDRLLDIVFEWLARLSGDAESKPTSGLAGELTPVAWFQGLHDEMNLSAEQKGKLAVRYIGLLSLKDSSTLNWTVQNLQDCDAQSLPVEDLVMNLSRLFYHKRKDPAVSALKLIESLEKNKLLTKKEAANAAIEALEHPSVEVQKKVLSYLKKSKMLDSAETITALQSRAEGLSGLVKKSVLEIVAKHSDPAASAGDSLAAAAADSSSAHLDVEAELQDLKERISALDTRLAELAEVRAVLNCLESDSPLPPCAKLDAMDVPRLDPAKKVQAIENVDDLIFLYLHILEGESVADDIERLLDGLMRFNHIRPDDFENRVSSLRKKLSPSEDRIRDTPATWSSFNGGSHMMDLQSLAFAWLNSREPKLEDSSGLFKQVLKVFGVQQQESSLPSFLENAMSIVSNHQAPLSFFSERCKAMVRLVSKRKSLPLLAAPTQQGGWIDPRVIPGRLAAWEKADVKLEKADVIQMLLRLAPEHRAETLSKIPQNNDESIRAIRYALGDEMKAPVECPELWVAAFRCRDPKGTSNFLKDRFSALGPDSAVAATYIENLDAFRKRHDGIYGTTWNSNAEFTPIQIQPAVTARANLKFFPIELLHDRRTFWDIGNNIMEYYYLQNREPYLGYVARRMAIYMESQGEYWKSSWNLLFDPDIPLNDMGIWVILFGLSSKQPESQRLALDALICAIEEDRVDGRVCGEKMARAYATEKITLSRWINGLREVFRITPMHLHFVQAACEACVAELPSSMAAKPPIPILELLYDASVNCKYAIRNVKARNFLEQIQGKGKASKLARLLLELTPEAESNHRKQAALQMLQSRIQRAERWMQWKGVN